MKTCKKCQVQVKGETKVCPLCKAVLSGEHMDTEEQRYPNVELSVESYNLINRVFLFISIIIIVVSVVINFLLYHGIIWSFASIGAVLYSQTVLRHAIKNNIHPASKIIVQAISGSLLIVIIDLVIGFQGWSVNYVIPQVAILANLAIFILMMINRMDWRNYMLYQLSMSILGFIPIILLLTDITTRPLMSYISTITSTLILVGTIVFGDKTVKSELIRRFHI